MSICRGGKSIMERLQDADIDPADYIGFYSLRSHDVIRRKAVEEALARVDGYTNDVEDEVEYTRVAEEGDEQGGLKNKDFVSEELYIHAKLMIVDGKSLCHICTTYTTIGDCTDLIIK